MKHVVVLIAICICAIAASLFQSSTSAGQPTRLSGVTLNTDAAALQRLFDAASAAARRNLRDFGQRRVLVEGDIWIGLWLETQPMGGEMFAKQDLDVARNNIECFFDLQRPNSLLPACINLNAERRSPEGWYGSTGFLSLARSGMNTYYLLDRDRRFLQRLDKALRGYDAWLWRYRDSDRDGCLETWAAVDTGEDSTTRFQGKAPNSHDPEVSPGNPDWLVPVASMDLMADSYDARTTLADIAEELKSGEATLWRERAKQVQDKMIAYLWRPEKGAMYDRDRQHWFLDTLLHNNLRVMYHGAFTQEMADAFVARHLLNPAEFWTRMPLPSIARNDALYATQRPGDSEVTPWCGPSMGLTYQRAIRALDNYGHLAEIALIGRRLLARLEQDDQFPVQFDPDTGMARSRIGNYGPTILACLEYISRMYGVHQERNEIWWGGLAIADHGVTYSQTLHGKEYRIENRNGSVTAQVDGRPVFTCGNGFRTVTDLDGRVQRVINIDETPHDCRVTDAITGRTASASQVKPNEVWAWDKDGNFQCVAAVPFGLGKRE